MERNKSATPGRVSAGFGEADITPQGGVVELAGQYYQRLSLGIHSRLKAVALMIGQGKDRTLFIALDVLGVPEDFCRDVSRRVAENVQNVSADRIVVSATHTHTAPPLGPGRNWWTPHDEALSAGEYRKLVIEKILEAVNQAQHELRAAGVSYTLQSARAGHCRRAVYADGSAEMYGRTDREDFFGLEGGEDSGVELFFFFDETGRPFGAIVNLACPSQVMEARRMVSSDCMGALREKLKDAFGSDFRALCQLSACGCQSPRDLARNERGEPDFWNEDGVDTLSGRLCEAVQKGCGEAEANPITENVLKHKKTVIDLPRRRVSYDDYVEAKKELERLEETMDSESAYRDFCKQVRHNENIPGRPPPYDSKLHHFVRIKHYEAILSRYTEQREDPSVRVESHCIRLGGAVFVTNPFELFLDYGNRIKARSRAEQTFIIQLANGYMGYLPTPAAEKHGGYGALVMNGLVGSDGGRKLADTTVDVIGKFFQ